MSRRREYSILFLYAPLRIIGILKEKSDARTPHIGLYDCSALHYNGDYSIGYA